MFLAAKIVVVIVASTVATIRHRNMAIYHRGGMSLLCAVAASVELLASAPEDPHRHLSRRFPGGGAGMEGMVAQPAGTFRGRFLAGNIVRVGVLMSMGNSPEVLSQRILVGIILVGRLGIADAQRRGEGDGKKLVLHSAFVGDSAIIYGTKKPGESTWEAPPKCF